MDLRGLHTEEQYAENKSLTGAAADIKRRWVDCKNCKNGGASFAAGPYKSQHDVFWSIVLQQEIAVDRPPAIYRAIKLIAMGKYS